MKIISLEAENFKILKAISIKLDPTFQVIKGRNAAGKSSCLDLVEMVLAYAAAKDHVPEPIQRGKNKAQGRVDLGEFIVERVFRDGGKTELKVFNADGSAELRGPQGVLDKIRGKFFDPGGFMEMPADKQRKVLLDLLEVDPTPVDERIATLTIERRDIGRDLKQAQAEVSAITLPANVPDEPVSAVDLLEQLNQMHEQGRQHDKLVASLAKANSDVATLHREIEELELKLRDKRNYIQEAIAIRSECQKSLAAYIKPDTADLQAKIADVGNQNRLVEQKRRRKELEKKAAGLQSEYKDLTEQLDELDQMKKDVLAEAKFPIEGLGFDDTNITLNGVPLIQLSDSEKMRVAMALGLASQSKLRVFWFKQGSLLDDERRLQVNDFALKNDCQVILELVGEGGPDGIIIRDGSIVEKESVQ